MTVPEGLRSAPVEAVHRITIDRPARRNALTPDLARGIAEAVEEASVTDARAIVLSGEGGHFCAGLDLHWLGSLGATPDPASLQRGLHDFQAAVLAIVRSPLPVIAVVQGTAAGFGLDLALACDFRIAGTSARFTSAFARMGLVPDGGSTLTLPATVGMGRAMRLLLADETVDGDRGLIMGLVDDLVEDVELGAATERLVAGLTRSAPGSVRAIKRLCRAAELGGLEQALAAEGAAQVQALQSDEFRRRAAAFQARAGGDAR
jgi:enoyl-CoA hydratase/carnithine racemase